MTISYPPASVDTAAPDWDDVAAGHLERRGTAECGCPTYVHLDDHADEYAGEFPAYATLHVAGACLNGWDFAEMDPRLALHIGFTVPADAPGNVSAPAAVFGGVLRGIPATSTFAAVATERAAEAAYAAAGIAAMEQKLAAAPFEAATLERLDEMAAVTVELGAYLATLPDVDARSAEIDALMRMTLADRAEALEAARTGRITRLGLRIRDLMPTARDAKHAWLRLREGAAGKWSVDALVPFSDEAMARLLNPVRPAPAHLGMFYARGLHILAGSGGIGKTWLALAACAGAVPAVPIPGHVGPHAVYLDLDNNYELYSRAVDLGLDVRTLQKRKVELMQVPDEARRRGCSTAAALRAVIDGLVEAPPAVVVADSLTRIIADLGESSDDNDAATRILSSLFDELAAKTCVIVLDHTGHEHARPRGASAKRDAVRVVLTVAPTDIDGERHPDAIAGGKLIHGKDRDGGIRQALADPADKSATPDLGLVIVNRSEETGRATVDLISQRTIAAAAERRETDAGQAFTAEAKKVLRRVIDAAARAAVNAHDAKARGCKPVPPLSARGAEEAAWEQLRNSELGGRKSDVRDALKKLAKEGAVVEYTSNWGSVPGARFRLAGGVTDGRLDPVDLA